MADKQYAMVPTAGAVVPGQVLGQVMPAPQVITVQCPPGGQPGQQMQITLPNTGQVIAVQIPPGCPPGGQFQVQAPPPVITAQPAGPAPAQVQEHVHALVREGGSCSGMKPLHSNDAMAYSRSLTPQQASIENVSGCHKCVPVTCVGFPGCVYTYNGACSEDCLWFPCCFLGCIPTPWSICCCTCEREQNAWITRDKHRRKTGYIVIVDHERGTLAHYGVKCCSEQLEDHPQCYCVKV